MKALIVDDDIATINVIYEKVNWSNLGIEQVFTAYNISQAKDVLLSNDVEIVISDIEMPQGTGLDLLTWYRENNMAGEFLLLTCHESFDYATYALKLNASEYLLKPFDVNVMEAALRKIVLKIAEKKKQDEALEYGKWAASNKNAMQLSFIRKVLEGREPHANDYKNMDLQEGEKYRLIISKITDIDRAKERMSRGLFDFVLENIHSEILLGNPENSRVVTLEHSDCYILVTVCNMGNEDVLEEKVKDLIFQIDNIATVSVSCCISEPVEVKEFFSKYTCCLKLLMTNVAYYRNVFWEEKFDIKTENLEQLLDVNLIVNYLDARDKAGFMGYLKKILNEKQFDKTLNDSTIKLAQREIWHGIYTFFAKKDIPADGFFVDEAARNLNNKASQSLMDMLKWANYLIEQLYTYIDSYSSEQSPVDKMKSFINLHYMENIGRTELASELGLNAEYVSKLFKKETGINLSDYIANFRVEKAKAMLEKGDRTISEVSEACGFENQTYFSTTFKKYTGVTPNQYKKK